MTHVKLTQPERAILANQNRILAELSEGNKDNFVHRAQIFENGYEMLYDEALGVHEAVPLEECRETFDILNMYRIIDSAIKGLTLDQRNEIDLQPILFEGFDANENTGHYGFAYFLLEDGRYKEHNIHDLNSHYTVIDKYRSILQAFKKTSNQHNLTFADLKMLVESV